MTEAYILEVPDFATASVKKKKVIWESSDG
jgi:hypothetical protein